MITTKVVFDHRGRAGHGEGSVEVRVTVDRKSYYINTGVKCRAVDFCNEKVKTATKDNDADNDKIRIVRRKVEQIVNDMLERGVEIDSAEIRRQVTKAKMTTEERQMAFLDFCKKQIPQLNLRETTRKHYYTLVKRIEEYGMCSLESLTVENIFGFDAWLHGKGISDAGVWNYHKRMKVIINRAVLFGLMDANPYDRLRGKFKRVRLADSQIS